jgi:soluble lytic murein transglycosylase-like protein
MLNYLHPRMPDVQAMELASVFALGADRNQLPVSLLVALAEKESGMDPHKVNHKTGAAGLMQLAPVHWKGWVDPGAINEVGVNVSFVAALLARYLRKAGSTRKAISRWHAFRGEGRDAWAEGVLGLMERLEAKFGRVAA